MADWDPLGAGPMLTLKEILARLRVSKSTWYEGMRLGIYPQPMRLSKRTVMWPQAEIDAALREMNKGRRGPPNALPGTTPKRP